MGWIGKNCGGGQKKTEGKKDLRMKMHIGQCPGIAGLLSAAFSSSFSPHPESAVIDIGTTKNA